MTISPPKTKKKDSIPVSAKNKFMAQLLV
jgi:hypothetical protein